MTPVLIEKPTVELVASPAADRDKEFERMVKEVDNSSDCIQFGNYRLDRRAMSST